MESDLLSSLSFDFSKLLKDSHNYDVIIKVDEKEFKAHSIILYTRSNYFKLLLSRGRIIKENNVACIEMTGIDPDAFEMIIMCVYIYKSYFGGIYISYFGRIFINK